MAGIQDFIGSASKALGIDADEAAAVAGVVANERVER